MQVCKTSIPGSNPGLVLLMFVALGTEVELKDVADALLITSAVMPTVGLLACIEPPGVRSGSIPPRL